MTNDIDIYATAAEGQSDEEESNSQRSESHSQATSSGAGSEGFYEGAGVNSVEVESCFEDADPTVGELRGCDMLEDVMDIVTEEAGLMSTAGVAFAISRCASLMKKSGRGLGNKAQAKKDASRITKGQEFALLLSLIQAKACEMTVQEVTTCLQSMATLEVKVVRVLRVLQAEIQARLPQLDERQMATIAWSFGSLKHNPGALLDLLAEAATPRLENFELQGLSQMLWAYGKLEHAPSQEFTSRMVYLFNEKMENFSPQSIANMMYSFGKMRRPLKASVCRKAEQAVLARPSSFKDLEVSNILYGLVKTRYTSPDLLRVMEKRIASKNLDPQTAAMAWATLVWAAGSMGLPLQSDTLDALQNWGLQDAAPFNPSSLCNLAWGLAILGEVHHPVFPQVVAAVVESHQRRTLEPRLMRQLFQAVSAARILGADLSIPEAVEGTAHKWWRHGTLSNPMSMSHEAVARAVRKLGLDSEAQHNAGYGLPSIDVAIEAEDGRDIALMVVSPSEYSINTDQQAPLGSMLSKKRLLEAAKWQVEIIPANSLPSLSNEPSCIKRVGKILEGLGLQTDWVTAVKKAPVPVPK